MKRLAIAMVIIIVIGILLAGVGCAVFFSSGIKFDELEYTERFFETEENISSLKLDLGNAHKVILERGEKCSVKYFDTDVTSFSVSAENGRLNISESGWSWKNWLRRILYRFKSTDVVITVPEGVTFDISGDLSGATVIALPTWQYGSISLGVSGAASVVANGITAEDIRLDVSGSVNMSISGRVDRLRTYTSGSARLYCDGLECPSIDMHVSGSSEINLSGTGRELRFRVSGSGRLWAKDFALESADIDASGSVKAELKLSTLLKVRTSGSSNIAYWGEPHVDESTSGSATIVKKG